MIRYLRTDRGGDMAIVACDVCGLQIEDPTLAVAISLRSKVVGEMYDAVHVHKGECDDRASLRFGGELKTVAEELTHHLRRLIHNTGLTPQDLRDLDGPMQEIASIE